MSYLAPPKTFELQLHWFQTASEAALPVQLAAEFTTLNSSNEFIVLGTIKNRVRFTATVFNSTIGAPVQYYDAYSVQVGDWIANNASGFAWRITELYTVQDNRFQQSDSLHFFAKMVDYASYNRGLDKRGRGIGCPSNVDSDAVLFTTDNYGLPILSGLDTDAIDPNFATVLQSRFNALNIKRRFLSIKQTGAAELFRSGDPIYIDSETGLYKKSQGLKDINIVQYTIGVVTSVGIPTNDYFTFSPFGEYRSASEVGLTGPIGTIFYIDPSGTDQYVTTRPEKFPFPVYQIIDTEANVILVNGDIFGIQNYAEGSTMKVTDLSVGTISALEKGGLIKFADSFYASSAQISTLNTDGIFFRSQNTASTITMLYADNTNTLYWDGKPLIPGPPTPYAMPSTIQVSSIVTANISGFDSTSAIVFSNPITAPLVNASSIQTSSVQANGLYLSNSNVSGLLTTDSTLTLLWNGQPIGSGGGGGAATSSYNNLSASSFSVSSIGSLNSSDVIYFKNPFAASEASISTLKTGGLLISGSNGEATGLLNADTNLNLYWNGKPIGQGQGSSISSFSNLAASSFAVSSIKAATSSGTIFFENAFQAPTANMSSLVTKDLRIEDANNIGASLQTDSNLQLLWNGKPIAQGSALSTFDALYANSLAVSSIKAIVGADTIVFDSKVSISSASVSSIAAVSLRLESNTVGAYLQTNDDLQLLWNGAPIGAGGASSQTISTFDIITASTVATNGINLSSESGSAFLQTNTNLELLWNGKPVGTTYSSFSKLTVLDLTVSSITGTAGSIILNSKLLASDATINNLNTNGINFQNSSITNSSLGRLYADDAKDLYWNGEKVIKPPVSSFNSLTTSSFKVSTIMGFGPSDAIYFANPIKTSTIYALNIGIQGQGTSSTGNLYALSDLSLMWNGIPLINTTGVLEINSIKAGTLESQNPGEPLVFKSPIQAGKANVKALASESISLKYKPTELQLLGASEASAGGALNTDANNNLLWNGKALISNTVSTFFVSSIGGFSSSDTLNFTGPIKATLANISTLSASGLELTGQTTENKATLYADAELKLFWNNKPLIDNKFPDIYVGAIHALESTQTIELKSNLIGLNATFSSLQTSELKLSYEDKSSILHTDTNLNLLWNGINITGYKSTILTSTLIASSASIGSLSTNSIHFPNGTLETDAASQLLFNGVPLGKTTVFDEIKVSSITGTGESIDFTTKIVASEAGIQNLNTQTIKLSDEASGNSAELKTDGDLNLLWNGKPINSSNNTPSQSSTLTVSTIAAFVPSEPIVFLSPISVPNITTSSNVIASGLGLTYNNTPTFLYTNEKKELLWDGKPLINNTPGSLSDKLILSTLAVSSIGSLDPNAPLYFTTAIAASNLATSSISFNGKSLYTSTNELLWDGAVIITSKTSTFAASTLSLNTLFVSTISSLSGMVTINAELMATKIATESVLLGLAPNAAALTTNESQDLLWNGKSLIQSNSVVVSSFTTLFASTASISTLSTNTIILAGRESTTSGELYADASLNLYWNGHQVIKTDKPGSETLKISSILVSTIGSLLSSDIIYITSKVHVSDITVSTIMTDKVFFQSPDGNKSVLYTKGDSIYFNNTPLISTSLTISSISVSTLSAQGESINLTSKLIGTTATISSINTNSLMLDYLDKSGVLTTDSTLGLFWNGKPVIQGSTKAPDTLQISSILVSSIGSLNSSDQIIFRNVIRASDAIISLLKTDTISFGPNHSTGKGLLRTDSSFNLVWDGVPLMQNTSTISIGDLETSNIKAPTPGATIQISNPIKAPSVEANGFTISQGLSERFGLGEAPSNTLQVNGANQITWNGLPLITDTNSTLFVSSIVGLDKSVDFANLIKAPSAEIAKVTTAFLELAAASTIGKLTMDENMTLLWNGTPVISKSSTVTQNNSTLIVSTIFTDGLNLKGNGSEKSAFLYADSSLNLYWNGAPLANTPGGTKFSSIEVSTISALNPQDTIYFNNSIIAPTANLSIITTTLININNGTLTTNANNELTWNGTSLMPSSMSMGSSFNTLLINNIGALSTGGAMNFISPFVGSTGSLSTFAVNGITLTGENTTAQALLYADKNLSLFWNGKPLESSANNLSISSLVVSSISAQAGASSIEFNDPIKTSALFLASQTNVGKLYTDDSLNLFWNGIDILKKSPESSQSVSTFFASSIITDGLFLVGANTNVSSLLYADENMNLFWNNMPLNSNTASSKFSSVQVSSINALTPGDSITFADTLSSENANIKKLRTTGVVFDSADSTATGLLYIDNDKNLIWNGTSLTGQGQSTTTAFPVINVSTIGALKPGDTIVFSDKFLVSDASISTLNTAGIRISAPNSLTSALLQADSTLTLLWNGKPLINSVSPSSIKVSTLVVNNISAENPTEDIIFENPIKAPTLKLIPNANLSAEEGEATEEESSKKGSLYTDAAYNLYWGGVKLNQTATSLSSFSTIKVSTIGSLEPGGTIFFTDGVNILDARISTLKTPALVLESKDNKTAILQTDDNLNLIWNGKALGQSETSSISSFVNLNVSTLNAYTKGEPIVFGDRFVAKAGSISTIMISKMLINSQTGEKTGSLYADENLNLIWDGKILNASTQQQQSQSTFDNINVSSISAINPGGTIIIKDNFQAQSGTISIIKTSGINIENAEGQSGLLSADANLDLVWNSTLLRKIAPQLSTFEVSSFVVSSIAGFADGVIEFTSPIKTENIILKPTQSKTGLYVDKETNLYWNSIQITGVSTTSASSISNSSLIVSSITANGLILIGKDTTNQSLLYADENLNLFWNNKSLSQSAGLSTVFSTITVSSISAISSGDKIYFTDNISVSEIDANKINISKIALNSEDGSKQGVLYADKDLNLIWNGSSLTAAAAAIASSAIISTFNTLNVGSIGPYKEGQNIDFTAPIAASDAHISSINTDGITFRGQNATGSALLYADTNLNLFWNGKPIIAAGTSTSQNSSLAISSLTVSSISGFTPQDTIIFNNSIETQALQLRTGTGTSGKLYTDSTLNLFWNGVQLNTQASTISTSESVFFSTVITNGLFLVGTDTTKQTKLYADKDQNLYWGTSQLVNAPEITHSSLKVSSISGISTGEKVTFLDSIVAPDIKVSKILLGQTAVGSLYTDANLNLLWNGTILGGGQSSISTSMVSTFSTISIGSINALEPNGIITFNAAFNAQDATISSIRADGISLVGKNTNVASLLYADEKQDLFWNGIKLTKSTASVELSTFAVSSLIVSTIAAFGPNDVIEFLNPLKTKKVLLSAGPDKQGELYTDDNLNLLWNGSTLSGLNNSTMFVSSLITTGLFLVSKDTSKSSLLYADNQNNLFWDNQQLKFGNEYSTLRVSSLFAVEANISTTKTVKILLSADNNNYGSLYTDSSLNLMWNGQPISANSTAMLSSFKTLNIGLIGPYAVNENIYFGAPIVASSATISTINTGGISITAQNATTSSLLYADEMLNLYWNGKSLTASAAASETLNISSIVVSTISGYNPQDAIVFTNAIEATGLNLKAQPGLLSLEEGGGAAQVGKLYTDATQNLFWNGIPLIKSTITFYSTLTISSLLTDGIFIRANDSTEKTQLYANKDQILYWGSTQIINNAKATHSSLQISTIAALNAADTIYFANPIYVSEANTSTIKTKLVTIETEDGASNGRLYADKNLNLMWNGSSLMAKVISTFSTINVGVIGPLPGSNAIYFSSPIVTVAANISTLNTTGIVLQGNNSTESSLLYADEKLNLFWQGKQIGSDKSTISVSSLIVSSISAYEPGLTIVFNNQIQTDGIKLVASDKSYSGTLYADGNKNIFWNGTKLNTSVDSSTLYISSLITDGLFILEKNTGISTQIYTEAGQLYWSSLQIINNPQVSHSSISVSTISALNKDDTLYFTNAFSAENATISSLNIATLNIQANGGQNTGALYADADLNLMWNGKAISQGSSVTQSSFTHINVSSIGALIPGSVISFTDKITASDGAISSLQTDGIVFRANTSNTSTTLYADANLNLIWNGVPLNNGTPSIFSTLKASTFQTGTIGSVNSTQKIYFTSRFYASDAEISTLFTSGVGLGLGILRTDGNSTLLWNNEPIIKSSMNISTLFTNIISSIVPNQPIIFNSDFQAPKGLVSSLTANTIILSNPDSTSGSLYTNSKLELLWNGAIISQISSFSTFKILSLNVSSIGSSDTIYFNTKFAASDAYIRNLATESLGIVNKETGLSSQLYADKNLVLQWNGKPLISGNSSFSTIFVSTIGALAGSSITFTSRFYASDATISTIRTSGLLILPHESNASTLLYADKELNLVWNNNKVLVQSTFINVSSLLVSTIGGLTDNIQFVTPVTVSSANISSLGVGLIKLGTQGLSLNTDNTQELFWNGKPLLKSSFIALQVSSFAVSTISAFSASDSIYFKSNISSATATISSLAASEILFTSTSTKLSLTINSTGEITWTGVPLIKRDPTVTISTLRTNNIRPEIDSGTIRFDGPIETKNIMTKGLSLSAGLEMFGTNFGVTNRENQLYVDANNVLFWDGAPVIRDTFSTIFVSSISALNASDSIFINNNIIAHSAFISTLSTSVIYLLPGEPSTVSSALYTNSTQVLYWNGKPLIDPSTLFISSLIAPDILSPTGVVNISGKLTATNAEISSLKTEEIYIKTGKLTYGPNDDLFWNNKSLTETTSTFSTIYASSISALNPDETIYFTSPISANNAEITNIATKGIVLGDSDGIVSSLLYTDSSLTLYWNSTVISGPATQRDTFSTIYVSSISALSPSDTIYFNNTFYASDAQIGQVYTNAIVLNNSTNTASSVLYADANLVLYWNNMPLIGGNEATLTSSFSTIYVSSIGALSPSDSIYFTNPIYASDATVQNLFTNNVTIRNSTNTTSSVLYTDDNLVLYWNNKPLNGGGQPSSITATSSFSTLYVSTIGALGSSDTIYFANSFYASDATVKKLFTSGIVLSEQSGLASSLLYTDSSLVLYWNNVPLGGQGSSSFNTLFASSIGALTPGNSISFTSPISSVEANISTVFTNGIGITGIGSSSTNGFLYADSTLNLYWNGKPVSANLQDPLKVSSLIVSSISAFDSISTIFFNNNFAGSTGQISTIYANGLVLTSRTSSQQGLIYSDEFMTLFWNGKPLVGSSFNTLYASDAVIDILFASDAIIGSLKASDAIINKITASDGSFQQIMTNYIGSEQKVYFTSELEAPKAFISDLTVGFITLEDQLSKKRGILNTDETLNLYWNSTLITTSTYASFNISSLKVSSISGFTSSDVIYFDNPFEGKVAEISSLKTAGVSFQYQEKLLSAISSAGVSSSSVGLLYADADENLIWNGKRLNLDPSTLTTASLFASSISGIGPSSVVDFVTPLAAQTIILKSGDKAGYLRTDSSLNLYWNSTLISGSQSASSASFSSISSLFVSSISALNPGDIIYFNSPISVSTAQLNAVQFRGTDTISTAILHANSSLELYWNNKKILIDPSTLRLSSLYVSSISAQTPSDIIYFNNPISVSTAQATGILLTGQDTSTAGLLYANSSLQLFWNGYPIAGQVSSLSSLNVANFAAVNATISSLSTNGIFFTGRDSSTTSLLYADANLDLYWNNSPISKLISSFERFTISSLEVSSINANYIKASDAFIGHLVASDASISKIIASDGFFNNIVTNYIGGNDTLYFTSPFAADKGIVSTVDANGLYLTGRSSFMKGLLHTDSSLVLYWNGSSIAGLQPGNGGGSTFSTLYASTAYINNLLATDAQIQKLTASDGTIFTLYSSDANIANISAGKAAIFTTLTNFLGAIPITQTVLLGVTEPVVQFTSPFTAGAGKIAQFSASDAFINTLYASDAFIHRITASDAKVNNIVANYIGGQQDKIYFTSPFFADIGNTSTIDANGLYLTGRSSFIKGLLHTDSSLVLYWNGSSIAGQQPGSGGIGGSTFSTLYAMRAYINYLYASDSYLQRLWASDAIIGQASVSTGSISTLKTSFITADEAIITQVATSIISLPKTNFNLSAVAPKAIQITSPFQATSGSFVGLFASDAKIDRLQASDAFITHLTASDAKINSIVANYIGGQQDIIYFTSPFQTDIGNASTLNANGLYLTGRSSFVKGLLHTDSSLVLYWNGSSIAGQQPGSGGIGGSTFSTLYAMRAYINYLYATDAYLQKLWASDAKIGSASVSTADISTLQASEATITTIATSFIGVPKTNFAFRAAKEIQFTSPFQAVEGRFVKLYASDAQINLLQASDAFINHLTASDAKVNNVTVNYIGSQQDTIYFTSPFQTDIGNASTLNANGLYLTGRSSFVKGLLHTDSSLVLYWNGSSIAGQVGGGGIGGSTFSTLYAMRAYINYLYATDSYLQRLWASDAIIGNASLSTGKISTLKSDEAAITRVVTSFIGAPTTLALKARASNQIQFTSPFLAVAGRFVKLYASDGEINVLKSSDAFIHRLTASDAKVNNIVANYIGGAQDNIYFTSPFQAQSGLISTVDADGLYLTGISSFKKGLLHTDSSLTLYWNGSSIIGSQANIINGGGSTFSTLYAMKAYINYLYASDSYLQKLWASDAIISKADISLLQADKGTITAVQTNFIGSINPSSELYKGKNQIEFTSPFQAIAGSFVKVYASDGTINLLKASDAFINHITASDAYVNNIVANYIGGSQDNIYFTTPFAGEKGSISTLRAYKARMDYIYVKDANISTQTGVFANISSISTVNLMAIVGNIPTIGTNIIGLPEKLYQPQTQYTMNHESTFISTTENAIRFVSPFQGLTGRLNKLIASDAVVNNILANYIGGNEDNIYFTSPFVGPEGNINTLLADTALINSLIAGNASISTLKAGYASISTLRASDALIYLLKASDATVHNLKAQNAKVANLVVTDSKIDNLLVNKIKILDNLSVDSFHTIDSFNSKLVASDTVINNITANYIGSHDDLLYITSPFKGSQAYIDKVIASDADIKWLRINKIGVIQPSAGNQSIEFVSKFEATAAKINTLEVSTLIFTDTTQQLLTNILVATGPSSKLGNRLLYKIDNNNWMGSKINSNDKQLIIKTVKWNGVRFLAAGLSRNKAILLQSKDGITWDVCNTVLDFLEINSINWYNEMWLIAGTPKSGTASTLLASHDGINWSIPSGFSDRNTIYSKLVHNGKRILALGKKSGSNLAVIINSTDGINWFNSETASFSIVANSAAWGGAVWIAVGESETDPTIKSIMRSKNGSRWTTSITGSALKIGKDILWNSKNKCWLACGIADDNYSSNLQKYANNTILRSTDGFIWTQVTNNPCLTATNTLIWQEPFFIASGDTSFNSMRISQTNTSIIKSKDGLNWKSYVNNHKGFISPRYGCLEKATYDNRNRVKMMNPQNIRTLTFELSSPEIQHYEITHNDKLLMVKFRKSSPAIFAEPENLQIHIYGAYFKEGQTVKIQCSPYEEGRMTLEEYTNAKYTLCSPNNELSMETTRPYCDSVVLSQSNILHITFYNGHWVKTYSI
jgi:hypothetical protein